jgi:hypothetical protein
MGAILNYNITVPQSTIYNKYGRTCLKDMDTPSLSLFPPHVYKGITPERKKW